MLLAFACFCFLQDSVIAVDYAYTVKIHSKFPIKRPLHNNNDEIPLQSHRSSPLSLVVELGGHTCLLCGTLEWRVQSTQKWHTVTKLQ